MQITLNNAGKRYQFEWIFRNLSYTFESGNAYAILGPNGSGKSTLLQCLSTYKILNEGSVQYFRQEKPVAFEPAMIALAAPYLELIEEYTVRELFQFQAAFKPYTAKLTYTDFINITALEKQQYKTIKQYSSGMKQRVKLALAVLSDAPVLLLDEPTTNLDASGVKWYEELMKNYTAQRIVIVGSNDEREYNYCTHRIEISDYKK
jgi:ABC-type multidrug transport system ATPase subunit